MPHDPEKIREQDRLKPTPAHGITMMPPISFITARSIEISGPPIKAGTMHINCYFDRVFGLDGIYVATQIQTSSILAGH